MTQTIYFFSLTQKKKKKKKGIEKKTIGHMLFLREEKGMVKMCGSENLLCKEG